jgi:hypothetical protein
VQVLHLAMNPLNKFAGPKTASFPSTAVADTSTSVNTSADTSANNALAVQAINSNTSVLEVGNLGPDSSKLNQRLKEMFKERITSFREAVYLLTGYKVTVRMSTDCFCRTVIICILGRYDRG